MFSRLPRAGLLAAPLLVVACSGSNLASEIVKPPVFEAKGQTKCGVMKSQAKPLIVEWPSSDRAALESMLKGGAVVVRYEGCEMEVLDQCRAPGGYRYSATTRQADRVTIRDADDLYANMPMGAAKLEGKLATAGQLNVAMTIVGRYEAEKARAEAAELVGTDCARATHVITGVTVGAFAFFAGADATVGTGVNALGVGARANGQSKRELITTAGDQDACKNATSRDANPPEGCGAFLRVEVASIKAPLPPVLLAPLPRQAALPPAQGLQTQPPQGYGPPPQGYGPAAQGYGYRPPPQGNGHGPPGGYSAPPPAPPKASCCNWSARFNAFDVIMRRATLEGEVKVVGPLTIGVSPSWIWGHIRENLDAGGFALAGNVSVYFEGTALRGWFLRGHFGYETFTATITEPTTMATASGRIQSPIFGGLVGWSHVFGRDGGFALGGAIGIGAATAPKQTLTASGTASDGFPYGNSVDFYDKAARIQLLGSFGLGVTF